jgi:hypothetical protein
MIIILKLQIYHVVCAIQIANEFTLLGSCLLQALSCVLIGKIKICSMLIKSKSRVIILGVVFLVGRWPTREEREEKKLRSLGGDRRE